MALDGEQIFRLVLDAQRAVNADTREDSVRTSIASAVGQILREGKFPGEVYNPPVVPTVSGDYDYALHADVARVISVKITDSNGTGFLEFISADEMERKRFTGAPQTNSKPLYWSVEGGTLYVYPTPNAAYTLTLKAERKLNDVSAIPEQFLDVVLNGARSFFDPRYIGPFEKGKGEVKKYFRAEREEQIEIEKDPMVQAHEAWQHETNVY